jgi:hypothetical protein
MSAVKDSVGARDGVEGPENLPAADGKLLKCRGVGIAFSWRPGSGPIFIKAQKKMDRR